MNYKNEIITERAKQSALWNSLSTQSGDTLPYLLERYLLLENWRRGEGDAIRFLHLLLAEAVTVLLDHEERIRAVEGMDRSAPKPEPVAQLTEITGINKPSLDHVWLSAYCAALNSQNPHINGCPLEYANACLHQFEKRFG